MSKVEKLIEQFLRDLPEVRFDEVQYLLESFGFEEKRSNGSHHTFRKESQRANNPAGADYWGILVVLQRLLSAAQPKR